MARAFGTFLRLQCRYTLHRWGPSWGKTQDVLGPSRPRPYPIRPPKGRMEGEMSVDELASTPMGGITQVASAVSALPARPDFIGRLPVAIYADDRQDPIDEHVGVSVVEVDDEGTPLRANAQLYALPGSCSSQSEL